MKFSIEKEKILSELQLLQGIVEKRNTMPILANILLKAAEKEIDITGTDLEVGLRTHFEAQIEEEGATTISGKKIFEIVKSIPEGAVVTFKEGDDLTMQIKAGESEFKILCLPKEDYPQVPEANFEKSIVFPLSIFQEMIDRVFNVITQEQRYYLSGALLILKNKSIELVSTDGHRLAYTSKALDNGIKLEKDIRVIVAKKTLGELRKLEDGSIDFDLDENNLFFRVKNRTVVSRIIEGKFPNFEAVIPKDNQNIVIVSKGEMTEAIRRVSLFSTERSKGIKLFISKKEMRLFSSNPEIGEARDKVDIEYGGEDIETGFNSQYLLDFLSTTRGERVRIELKDANSSVMMKPEAAEDVNYLYVLMPMKL
jgi:DNA polymerase-3 subunit beta